MTKGKTYLIKHKSALGHKSQTVVHAPDKKAAEKFAKELHPQSGSQIKVSRYKTKGVDILKSTAGEIVIPEKKQHEATEPMGEDDMTRKILDRTFTNKAYNTEDIEELPE